MARKGREQVSQTNVRKREKAGKSADSWDCTISCGEIPLVAQGEMIPGHLEEHVLLTPGQKASPGVIESNSTAGSEVHAEGRKPLNFSR